VNDPEFLSGFPDLTVTELVRLLGLAARTRALMEGRKLAVVSRDRWPEVCEHRVKNGLKAVRKIIGKGSG
jgi:hypothetical protein